MSLMIDFIMKSMKQKGISVLLFSCITVLSLFGQEYFQLKDLQGQWKFTINPEGNWKDIDYNDDQWDAIRVPSPWENQGYHGFNGLGYYRKEFTLNTDQKLVNLLLHLGYIDDVDEVYFNGRKIGGSGGFPPKYYTAYNSFRKYHIPKDLINTGGKNVIAVKVYDAGREGGIIGGEVALYAERNPLQIEVDLAGEWKFKKGDDPDYKNTNFDDGNWSEIFVPGTWEEQGYGQVDGYGWYRRTFFIPEHLEGKWIVITIGSIDDADQTFLNGQLVGSIGEFYKVGTPGYDPNDYQRIRAYYLSPDKFKAGKQNTIAIRVFDGGGIGGIYKGPVGIVEKDNFVSYWRQKK
jgi:sialate O-acetylesterase